MNHLSDRLRAGLAGFLPPASHTRPLEWGRAALGAPLGVLCAALLCSRLFGLPVALSLLGPVGASAILLFAVSSGALSQPWSIVGGYLTAALVAVAAVQALGHGLAAACLALAATLLLMYLLRCLHPPGAAVALCVVLAPALSGQGLGVLAPVMLYALSLLGAALLFNNLTGVRYPRVAPPSAEALYRTADLPAERRVGIASEDLGRALAEFGGFVDLAREDLEALIRRTEQHALRRHVGELDAARIMSRDLRWATPDTPLEQALQMLQYHHLKALPVVDAHARLVGIVSLADLIGQVRNRSGLFGPLGRRAATVAQAMSRPVVSVSATTHVVELIPLLSREGLHCLPVLDDGRLVGLISQTDLIAALQRQLLGLLGTPAVSGAGERRAA